MIVGTLNFMDRQIMNILAESVKVALKLADWQLGLLTGLAFAVLYSAVGIPVARLADRVNRPLLLSIALTTWCSFTVFSGLAMTFGQMLLARIGVGAGEAGGTPTSHSLVSALTTPKNRASAFAFISLAQPFGALLGLAVGGLIADALGWRLAFMIVGAPGLFVALLLLLTVRDPQERVLLSRTAPLSAFREIRQTKTFWWVVAGCTCTSFVVYGHGAFYGSIFMRQYKAELAMLAPGLGPLGVVGLILGVVKGLGGAAGTIAGGYIAERLAKRDVRSYCTVPAVALMLCAPSFALVLVAPSAVMAALLLVLPSFLGAIMYGPSYAMVQTLVRPESRATASAVFLFIVNVVGLGLGPLIIGVLSDSLSPALGAANGLKWAMIAVTPVFLFGAGFFWLGRRTVVGELRLD
jgi:predicted MFS family arabinose efflux permease